MNDFGLDTTQYAAWVTGYAGAGGTTLYVLDSAGSFQAATTSIEASPTGATQSGSTVTITTSSPHGLQANDPVTIAGVGVADYNGNFTVATATSTTFTYTNPITGLGDSGGGTVTRGLVPVINLANLSSITIDDTINNVSSRLTFFVSALNQPPTGPAISGTNVTAPPTPPYTPGTPNTTPPFDILEFTYISGGNSTFDLSAVNGFGMPLTLSGTVGTIGVTRASGFTRAAIATAFTQFMANDPLGSDFAQLLYDSTPPSYFEAPPAVPLDQFYVIADPNDWLINQGTTNAQNNSLADYWDRTLTRFFQDGNSLSINLSAGAPNIYSGTSSGGTYTLSNGTNTYQFSNPGTGLAGAQYVFGQSFTTAPAPDEGLLQDNIWEALSRGVALDGVSTTPITNGESTTAWNNPSQWYKLHASAAFPDFSAAYNTYAKFLHYSTLNGTDSRTDSGTPIFVNNQAYGFSEDENPNGPYTGGEVPSKFDGTVPDGSTLTLTIDPWTAGPSKDYFAVGSGAGVRATVKVYEAPRTLVKTLSPFSGFTGGVRVATGDVNGDGTQDLIVGQGRGGKTLIKIFDGTTFDLVRQFKAFPQRPAQRKHVGVYVSAADVNNDGHADVVVGAGARWKPFVRVFSGADGSLLKQFLAFPAKFPGGVRVAAGDIDKDGFGDIVAARGRGSQVTVFDGKTCAPIGDFNPYQGAASNRHGVYVAVGDVQGNGNLEIVTGTGPKIAAEARVFDAQTREYIDQIFIDATLSKGIPLGLFDTNGDGKDEVLIGRGPGEQGIVDLWQFKTATNRWLEIDGFTALPGKHGNFVG